MKHKTLSFLLALLMSMVARVSPAYAVQPDNGNGLSLYTRSESGSVTYSMDEIRKITFSDKGVQIWVTEWPTEYTYSQFRVLALGSLDETGIGSLSADKGERAVDAYYDLQGRKVISLAPGVYIKRSADGTTRKVLIPKK